MSWDRSVIQARNSAMLETVKPDWAIFDCFTSLELHANKAGFEYLANKFTEIANAMPGDDLWLPIDARVVEMGPQIFVLQLAGEKPAKSIPSPTPSDDEQLNTSRDLLIKNAGSALHLPPES